MAEEPVAPVFGDPAGDPAVPGVTAITNHAPAQPEPSDGDDVKIQLATLTQKITEMAAQGSRLSSAFGALEGKFKKQVHTSTEDPGQPKGITSEESEVEKLRSQLRRKDVIGTLQGVLTEVGAGSPRDQAKYLADKFDDRISVTDDAVMIEDGTLGPVPLSKFIPAYVKTDAGAWMVPAKRASAGSLDGDTPPSVEQKKVTVADLNAMSPEDLAEGIKNNSFDVQM